MSRAVLSVTFQCCTTVTTPWVAVQKAMCVHIIQDQFHNGPAFPDQVTVFCNTSILPTIIKFRPELKALAARCIQRFSLVRHSRSVRRPGAALQDRNVSL